MRLSRRRILAIAAPLLAAPAIVRAGMLMPVKTLPPRETLEALVRRRIAEAEARAVADISRALYSDASERAGGIAGLLDAHVVAPSDDGGAYFVRYTWEPKQAGLITG